MPLFRHPDGTPIKKVKPVRVMMNLLLPARNEAVVYVEHHLDVTDTLTFIEHKRANGEKLTLFHVYMAAAVRMLSLRPGLNRFAVGRWIYQRDKVDVSFAIKRSFDDEGELTSVRARFAEHASLAEVSAQVRRTVRETRENATPVEKETAILTKLPGFVLTLLLFLQRVLDRWNLLPGVFTKDDPLYAAMSVTNVGSVGLEAVFHHPFNYGTVSLFTALGPVRKVPTVLDDGRIAARDVMTVRYAFDERICDGYYLARSLEVLKSAVEDPAVLEGTRTLAPALAS